MATIPDLTDAETWPDADLDRLRVAVLREQERRTRVAAAQGDRPCKRQSDARGRAGDDRRLTGQVADLAQRVDAPGIRLHRVGDAVGPQRRHERSGDVVLPDDLLEGVGTVAAVQSGGHGPSLIGRADPVRGTGRVGSYLAR